MSRRFLVDASIKQDTAKKYKDALLLFIGWCETNNYDTTSDEEMDELLTDYLHDLYENGVGRHVGTNTFFGLLKYQPRYTNKLHSAYASLQGWAKLRPSESYPPLTWDLTVLIAVTMAKNGYFRQGVGCLLAFDCFLRVGELVNLRRDDVAVESDARVGGDFTGVALRLRHTKTGKNQWVTVDDGQVKKLLLALVGESSSDEARIFPFSAGQFRNLLKTACAALSLSSKYVPHSLRHGGATRMYLRDDRRVEDVIIRGRWASTTSARRYIQAGRAMLLSVDVPSSAASLARILSLDIARSLSEATSQFHKCGVQHRRQ